MSRRKTDGERIAGTAWVAGLEGCTGQYRKNLALDINRLIRRRMAEAWGDGWFAAKWDKKHVDENPYRGRRRK